MSNTDFDLADWAHLPPLDEADLPTEPPPEREHVGGIMVGSELADHALTNDTSTDLGHAIHADLFSLQPGLGEIARLGSTDFTTLNAVQRIDALIAFQRQHAWAHARMQELLALISTRDRTEQHWCVEEVGAALRVPGGAARTVLANAEQLTHRLPATSTALSEGRLTTEQATAITRISYQLPDDLLPAFESRVLRNAEHQTLTNLTRTARRAVLALDPATAEHKHQHALADRYVRIAPAEHGMAWLIALLPAEDAHTLYARLHGAARATLRGRQSADQRPTIGQQFTADRSGSDQQPGTGQLFTADQQATLVQQPSIDQLRADALVNAVLNGVRGSLATEHGHQPAIGVIVSLNTLIGKDDEPGWLDGYGAITAQHARRIAHDPTGTWRRLITDPVTGQLLDHDTAKYKPPRHLTDHIIARDAHCTFPYCNHTARQADLDHLQPYPAGPTSAANLHPLHRRHHNAKTHAGWRPRRNPATGHTRWTSPQGRDYQTQPPQRWTLPDDPPF